MTTISCCIAVVLAGVTACGPSIVTAQAAALDLTRVTPCNISGYTEDPDPQGTNVRAAPRRDAPVIGVLPHAVPSAGTTIAPEFEIIGSRDGWLLIRDAFQGSYEDAPERRVFAGPGWVAGNLVRFTINSSALRAAPHDTAREVLQLFGSNDASGWGPDSVTIERVHGCSGSFAEVSIQTPAGKRARGWATHLCNNQVTTCP
jgi:hypothetical protein